MILKRYDDIIKRCLFDCDAAAAEVEVKLVEPLPITTPIIQWQICGEGIVQRETLFYNDAENRNNFYIRSWQIFYKAGTPLDQAVIYGGGDKCFKGGQPCFGGIAKAGIYLRYSAGFRNWVRSFDPAAAAGLDAELESFEKIVLGCVPNENGQLPNTNKKMPTNWQKFDPEKGFWHLISVCRLSNGRRIVLFIGSEPAAEDCAALADLGIDVEHSVELAGFCTAPAAGARGVVDNMLQMGSGLGRNPFGKNGGEDNLPEAEYLRLRGVLPDSTLEDMKMIAARKQMLRFSFAPNPDSSYLLFLPEGSLRYSQLEYFVQNEKNKRETFFLAVKEKKSTEEREQAVARRPDVIPIAAKSTVMLINIEGSRQKKIVVQQAIPNVSLSYFFVLNSELIRNDISKASVQFMKGAMTGQDKNTPSVEKFWTYILTSALQRRYISGIEVWQRLQSFCRLHSGESLVGKDRRAAGYFRLIGKLLRIQHLIHLARTAPDQLGAPDLTKNLTGIERFEIQPAKGVFEKMNESDFDVAAVIGENYDLLRDGEKEKLNAFVRRAIYGVPAEDFASFVRGGLTGMLLQNLCESVKNAGRQFSITMGRQPTRLRGEALSTIFSNGIGKLITAGNDQTFNCNMYLFVISMEQESGKDSFNNGLIAGITFLKKQEENN